MDPRTIFFLSFHNSVLALIYIQLSLGIALFIGEIIPEQLAFYAMVFIAAPYVLYSIYLLIKTPTGIGERHWVKTSSNNEIQAKNTLLLDNQYQTEDIKKKKQKLLIISGAKKWDLTIISIFLLGIQFIGMIISVYYEFSFWFVFIILFTYLLIWLRIIIWSKTQIDLITKEKLVGKAKPEFKKQTILNLEKIFKYYEEITIKDLCRILSIRNESRVLLWFRSLNFKSLNFDDSINGLKIDKNFINDEKPEIINKFTREFLI